MSKNYYPFFVATLISKISNEVQLTLFKNISFYHSQLKNDVSLCIKSHFTYLLEMKKYLIILGRNLENPTRASGMVKSQN